MSGSRFDDEHPPAEDQQRQHCGDDRQANSGHLDGSLAAFVSRTLLIQPCDGNGHSVVYRVIAVRDFRRNSAPLTLARPDVVAQFQTCLNTDGSLDRILDAVLA